MLYGLRKLVEELEIKREIVGWTFLVCLMIGMAFVFSTTMFANSLDDTVDVSGSQNTILSDLTPHDPIIIESDEGFKLSPGWTGSGTSSDPYVLEGYRITLPVNISNTRAYFVIRNCEISFDAEYTFEKIELHNTTNGMFEDCLIRSFMIFLRQVNHTTFRNVTWGYDRTSPSVLWNGIYSNESTGITIENCIFNRQGYAISADRASNWVLDHNAVSESTWGIVFRWSTNCSFLYNEIIDAPFYVLKNDMTSFYFEGNTIDGKPLGIFVGESSITVDSNDYGQVMMYGCSNVKVSGNHVESSGSPVVTVIDSQDVEITGVLSYDSPTGIYVEDSSKISVHDNRFDYAGVGIDVYDSIDIEIFRNNFTGSNYVGIQTTRSSCRIYENRFQQTSNVAVSTVDCKDTVVASNLFIDLNDTTIYSASEISIIGGFNITVQENKINSSAWQGIRFGSVKNSTVVSNAVSSTRYGIVIEDSKSNVIRENRLFNNTCGIMISNSSSSLITHNVVYHNEIGIGLDETASLNRLYSNILTFNSEADAIDDGYNNYCDDGVGTGNFWGNYTGSGIYLISGSAWSIDHYPQQSDIDGDGISDMDEIRLGRDPFIPDPTLDVTYLVFGIAAIVMIVVVLNVLRSRFKTT